LDKRILVVDDELSMREFLEILLTDEGYKVQTAESYNKALKLFGNKGFPLVVTDLKMPGGTGIDLLRKLKDILPETEVLMMTAYASTNSAVEAMKCGAYDYIMKPFKIDEIKLIISKVFDKIRLENENLLLKKELKESSNFGEIIGLSPGMQEIYRLIKKVAPTRSNVLITGESGTGKELVARSIHFNSQRSDHTFITINCGAMPANLLESELFGHVKGAFTGAVSSKPGLFELADEGSIFLDEIGEMPLALQVKLLRVIQEREFRNVGSTEDIKTNARIIAASNKDLEKAIADGDFREDLYYRLNVIQIKLPPLRERREDIPPLVDHFISKHNKELKRNIRKISSEALQILGRYPFYGNVRELENIVERAVALEKNDVILPESFPDDVRLSPADKTTGMTELPADGLDIEKVMEEVEKDLILKALQMAGGVKTKAAKLLKVSFRSFRYRLAKYGLDD